MLESLNTVNKPLPVIHSPHNYGPSLLPNNKPITDIFVRFGEKRTANSQETTGRLKPTNTQNPWTDPAKFEEVKAIETELIAFAKKYKTHKQVLKRLKKLKIKIKDGRTDKEVTKELAENKALGLYYGDEIAYTSPEPVKKALLGNNIPHWLITSKEFLIPAAIIPAFEVFGLNAGWLWYLATAVGACISLGEKDAIKEERGLGPRVILLHEYCHQLQDNKGLLTKKTHPDFDKFRKETANFWIKAKQKSFDSEFIKQGIKKISGKFKLKEFREEIIETALFEMQIELTMLKNPDVFFGQNYKKTISSLKKGSTDRLGLYWTMLNIACGGDKTEMHKSPIGKQATAFLEKHFDRKLL